jgi:electron transport complex protein RnfD
MWMVFGCALGTALYSAATDRLATLGLVAAALAAALPSEALALHFARYRAALRRNSSAGGGSETKLVDGRLADGSAAASALILVLLLPNRISPVCVILGAVFAMLIIKFSFGGLGANWVNPALGAWLLIRLSWPGLFNDALALSVAPVVAGDAGGTLDTLVRGFLNKTVFALIRAELPSGYVDLFLGTGTAGIVADRGLPLLVLGTLALSATQANRAWIPAVYLAVYLFLVRVFGALPFGGAVGQGDMLLCLFSGGTLAAAFLVISDPVTGAKTWPGMLICSALAAALTFLFRYVGGELYGAFVAAALVNALIPLVRTLEART